MGVSRIEAGYSHSCALLSNPVGQVRCWGRNSSGQLGNGTIGAIEALRPKVVKNVAGTGPLSGVTRLALNSFHTCVRLGSGQARCWGYGNDGQLGDGGSDDRPLPVKVTD